MALAKFFIEQAAFNVGDDVTLSDKESHHAIKVRRMKQGDEVMLLNGVGTKIIGTLQNYDHKALIVHIESVTQAQTPKCQINIAVALPKGDRQKYMLDMLTQLGVASITPLLCDYSVSQYSEKIAQRWKRTLLEACKQSENPFLPEIYAAQSPLGFIEKSMSNAQTNDNSIYYADRKGDLVSTLSINDEAKCISILIGPEGGYSDSELSMLEKKSISKLRLSRYILRVETAAIAAAAAFAN